MFTEEWGVLGNLVTVSAAHLEAGMDRGQVTVTRSALSVLLQIQPFPLNQHSSGAAHHWLLFRVLKEQVLTVSAVVLIALMEHHLLSTSLTLSGVIYQLSHGGSPRILKWVAYPFSVGPS